MDRLDLRLVAYFVAVGEELHFGRAATRLRIAQPSLSYQIKRLEDRLGVKLLLRSTRQVQLTTAGQVLLRDGRHLLDMADQMVRNTRMSGRERLVVGFGGSAGGKLLTHALRLFETNHPAVPVELRELRLDAASDILGGEVDVALTRLEPGMLDAEVEVVAYEPRVAALPREHDLASRPTVELAQLSLDNFISNPLVHGAGPPASWIAEQYRHGLPGRPVAEATSIQETLTLVATGRGICLLPASVADMYQRPDIRYVAVQDAEPAVLSLAWNPRITRPIVGSFIRVVRQVAKTQPGSTDEIPVRGLSSQRIP